MEKAKLVEGRALRESDLVVAERKRWAIIVDIKFMRNSLSFWIWICCCDEEVMGSQDT